MKCAARKNSHPRRAGRRSTHRAASYALEPLDRRLLLSAAIPAGGSVTSDFNITGESFGITSLTVDLNATFANDSNLSVTLTSPLGTTIQLFKNPAAESNFSSTVFDDSAPEVINQVGVPAFTGSFKPQAPLSEFNGENPNGDWKLTITNNSPTLRGSLINWSVIPLDQDPATGAYPIPNGQTTPNSINGTDFGATVHSLIQVYTITKTASGMLIEGSAEPYPWTPAAGSNPTPSISGPDAGDFAIVYPPVFPTALGTSSTFYIAFTPSAAGTRSATITLQDSSDPAQTFKFAVRGTGIRQGSIQLEQPNPYISARMTVAITNTGLHTLQLTEPPFISGITITSYFGGHPLYPSLDPAENQALGYQFEESPPFVLDNAYPATLAPGETYDLNVSFDPFIASMDTDEFFSSTLFEGGDLLIAPYITIDSSDPIQPSLTFKLSTLSPPIGAGDSPLAIGQAQAPSVNLNPDLPFIVFQDDNPLSDAQTLNLGDVLEGNNADQHSITLSNDGNDNLLYSLTTSGSGFTATALSNGAGPGQTVSILISPDTSSLQTINGSILLSVTDMQTNIEEAFTLYVDGQVIAPLTPPAFTSAPSATFNIGSPNSFTITTTGSPAPRVTCAGSLPSGLKFTDNGDGTATLSGTPTATTGVCTLQLTAANSGANSAAQSFKLTLVQSPKITSQNHAAFTADKSNTFAITAAGSPSANINLSGTLPTGITFNPKTNTLSGTPTSAAGGTYPLTFTATNGAGTPFIQSFTLTVNSAPQFTNLNNTAFTIGAASTFSILTSGFPNATVTASGTLPKGITLNKSAQLVGTPTTTGTFKFTLTAANSVASVTQAFTLTVTQPTAFTSKNTATFKHGQSSAFSITTSGFPAATLTDFTPTAGLTFTTAANGAALLTISKTLPAGTYNLIFTATPSGGTRLLQLFTLIVN